MEHVGEDELTDDRYAVVGVYAGGDEAEARLVDVTVQDVLGDGVYSDCDDNGGATIWIDDSVVEGVTPRETMGDNFVSSGLSAYGGAIYAENVTVDSIGGPGVDIWYYGVVTCDGCEIYDVTFAGVGIFYGVVSLQNTKIHDVTRHTTLGGGVGIWAASPEAYVVNYVILEGSSIYTTDLAGIYLVGDGAFYFTGDDLEAGAGWPNPALGLFNGNALFATSWPGTTGAQGPSAWDWGEGGRNDLDGDESGLLAKNNTFHGSAGAAVLLNNSSATLTSNTYEDNDLDLVWQECDGSSDEPEGTDDPDAVRACAEGEDWMPYVSPNDCMLTDLYLEPAASDGG